MKRTFDLVVASTALIVLAPLLAVLAWRVHQELGRPVLFRQTRPGFAGHPFTMYKFRTMRDSSDGQGDPLPDALRVTPFGRWLRSTSLDELPELWNVVRGDMSLVGPRPLRMAYLHHYTTRQARRHEVRPGITGWAQIHGRNRLTWEERFELDVWYVDHAHFRLDLQILWRTVGQVLRREGVNPENDAPLQPFRGSRP